MVSGSDRDAHLPGHLAGMLAETERRVDMHRIHAQERRAEQRIARFGELHLLLLRHPAHQWHMVYTSREIRRPDADQTHMMPLTFQLLRPLQGGIRSAVAPVARCVDHHGDGQRSVGFLLFVLKHAPHPTPMAQ